MSTRFYGDALVVFHHLNAYEADGHVVFDLITYKDSNLYDMFYIQTLKQETGSFSQPNKRFSPPVCQRFVLPLNINKVQSDSITQPKTLSSISTLSFSELHVCMRSLVMYLQDSPRGSNLVTLTDTTAQAVMQENGSIYCQPDTLFEGSLLSLLSLCCQSV